jgi:hypothetical protein
MAVQVPRKVGDLIRPDAPASEARTALGLGDAAVHDDADFAAVAHTHTATAVSDFAEAVDDRVAALLVAGTGVTLTYSDPGGTLTVAAAGASIPDPLTVGMLQGSTASGGNLTLRSTSHATGGTISLNTGTVISADGTTIGIGAGSVVYDGTGSIILNNGFGQVFRGANSSGWADNASALFFQCSTVNANLIFGTAGGNPAARLLLAGWRVQVTGTLYPGVPVPTHAFEVRGSITNDPLLGVWDLAGTKVLALDSAGRPAFDLAAIRNAADDTAAAALSPAVPIGGLYRTASVLKIRVT